MIALCEYEAVSEPDDDYGDDAKAENEEAWDALRAAAKSLTSCVEATHAQEKDLDGSEAQVGDEHLLEQFTTLNSQVTALKGQVTALKSQVTALNSRVAALEAKK